MSFVIMFLKKVIKLLFNRIFYVVLAMLLQLIWLFLLVWKLAEYSEIYFSGHCSDQCDLCTVDPEQKNKYLLQTGMDNADHGFSCVWTFAVYAFRSVPYCGSHADTVRKNT